MEDTSIPTYLLLNFTCATVVLMAGAGHTCLSLCLSRPVMLPQKVQTHFSLGQAMKKQFGRVAQAISRVKHSTNPPSRAVIWLRLTVTCILLGKSEFGSAGSVLNVLPSANAAARKALFMKDWWISRWFRKSLAKPFAGNALSPFSPRVLCHPNPAISMRPEFVRNLSAASKSAAELTGQQACGTLTGNVFGNSPDIPWEVQKSLPWKSCQASLSRKYAASFRICTAMSRWPCDGVEGSSAIQDFGFQVPCLWPQTRASWYVFSWAHGTLQFSPNVWDISGWISGFRTRSPAGPVILQGCAAGGGRRICLYGFQA